MNFNHTLFGLLIILLLAACLPATQQKTMDEQIVELRGTKWTLDRPNDLEGTLIVDTTLNRISGFNGCNQYSAEVDVQNYQVEFGKFLTTEKFCPDKDDREQEFMFLLSKTTNYRATKNKLYLSNRGENLLTFERIEE